MGEKISFNQLDKLINELNKHEIPSQVVLILCNTDSLAKLNVVQYNYLLMLISRIDKFYAL